jgi:DNA-binding response OmpR family regulator
MDCQMPVMDGYDATQALRRQPQWRELPVVAMTANAMVGDREKALAAGMNDHVAKPINVDELFATLARWIRRPALAPDRSALPPLDVHAALTRLGGDRRLHRRVMQMFLEQEAAFRDQFAAARAVADTAAMVRLAHDLKSVSGTLHAAGLSEAAAALESACRRGASEQEIDLRFQAVTARLDR